MGRSKSTNLPTSFTSCCTLALLLGAVVFLVAALVTGCAFLLGVLQKLSIYTRHNRGTNSLAEGMWAADLASASLLGDGPSGDGVIYLDFCFVEATVIQSPSPSSLLKEALRFLPWPAPGEWPFLEFVAGFCTIISEALFERSS